MRLETGRARNAKEKTAKDAMSPVVGLSIGKNTVGNTSADAMA